MGRTVISSEEYRELVARVREVATATLPTGTTAIVVSRGDSELVELPGLHGWHFPRGPGGVYAGQYPETGTEAVAHLEELRREGAEYLVVPRTALWWLEHYSELGRHVRERCRLVADVEGACRVFALEGTPIGRRGTVPEPSRTVYVDGRVTSFLGSLLPPGAGVVWLGPPGLSPPALDGHRTWMLPQSTALRSCGQGEYGEDLRDRLERIRAEGGEFLVIPTGKGVKGDVDAERFLRRLDDCFPRIARRKHLCSIYRLPPPSSETAVERVPRRRVVDG